MNDFAIIQEYHRITLNVHIFTQNTPMYLKFPGAISLLFRWKKERNSQIDNLDEQNPDVSAVCKRFWAFHFELKIIFIRVSRVVKNVLSSSIKTVVSFTAGSRHEWCMLHDW